MAVVPKSPVRISALSWVPEFAQGYVRDLRLRWALEEAGIDYSERLFDPRQEKPADYFTEQPFGQVPSYVDPGVTLFETGAIVLHIGGGCETLLPSDPAERAQATAWVFAALNSVETWAQQLGGLDAFHAKEAWAIERRPQLVAMTVKRLQRVEDFLGERDWLGKRFTAGDLMMATVLRILDHTDLVTSRPRLAAYLKRCLERPAFGRALAAQMAAFRTAAA